ncbi:MAG: hypothetical protein QNJ67_13605 [Kiloniellales bacterium]|nr:hypothetical protein [Kiloniellales bacterium]
MKILRSAAAFTLLLAMTLSGELAKANETDLEIRPFLVKLNIGDRDRTFVKSGNLRIFARCTESFGAATIEIFATSSRDFLVANFGSSPANSEVPLTFPVSSPDLQFNQSFSAIISEEGADFISLADYAIGVNVSGADCYTQGTAEVLVPDD